MVVGTAQEIRESVGETLGEPADQYLERPPEEVLHFGKKVEKAGTPVLCAEKTVRHSEEDAEKTARHLEVDSEIDQAYF